MVLHLKPPFWLTLQVNSTFICGLAQIGPNNNDILCKVLLISDIFAKKKGCLNNEVHAQKVGALLILKLKILKISGLCAIQKIRLGTASNPYITLLHKESLNFESRA